MSAETRDPFWVPTPTEDEKVQAALDAVDVSAGEVMVAFTRMLEGMQEKACDQSTRAATFEQTLAQLRLAWAVYHGAVADARTFRGQDVAHEAQVA